MGLTRCRFADTGMLDRKFIGHRFPPHSADVEKGQLLFFAKATGETDPVYLDEDAARQAGHPALPAPPTFAFSLALARPDPFAWMEQLDIDLGRVLHGDQSFEYSGQIYAGDRITLEAEILDIFDRKGGALDFVVQKTSVRNQRGEQLGSMISTTIVRN